MNSEEYTKNIKELKRALVVSFVGLALGCGIACGMYAYREREKSKAYESLKEPPKIERIQRGMSHSNSFLEKWVLKE